MTNTLLRRIRLLVLAAALPLATLATPAAHAALITPLSDPTGLTLINDFESTVNTAELTWNATAFLDSASIWSSNVTPSGVQGLLEDVQNDPLTGNFAAPVFATGFWFGNDDFNLDFDVILEVFDGITSLGSVSVTANGNDFADQFIGLSSDMAFDSVQISYQRPEAELLSIYIDDAYISREPVPGIPLPAPLALICAGLLLLRLQRR